MYEVKCVGLFWDLPKLISWYENLVVVLGAAAGCLSGSNHASLRREARGQTSSAGPLVPLPPSPLLPLLLPLVLFLLIPLLLVLDLVLLLLVLLLLLIILIILLPTFHDFVIKLKGQTSLLM